MRDCKYAQKLKLKSNILVGQILLFIGILVFLGKWPYVFQYVLGLETLIKSEFLYFFKSIY